MKRIISFISIFVLLINLFAFPIPVKADGLPIPGYTELKEMQQDVENGDNRTLQDIWKVCQPIGEAIGVIMNPVQTIEFIRDMVDPVAQTLPDYPTNGTDTDKANYLSEYLINNTTTNDNNKSYTLNQNAKNMINGIVNNFMNDSGYDYCYSLNIENSISKFPNSTFYNKLHDLLSNNTYTLAFMFQYKLQYYVVLLSDYDCAMIFNQDYVNNNVHYCQVSPYSRTNWTTVNVSSKYGCYHFDNNTNEFIYQSSGINVTNLLGYVDNAQIVGLGSSAYNNIGYYVSVSGNAIVPVYKSVGVVQGESVGSSPYYINSNTYNNYKNSSGDYIVNTDNSNRATYTNVTNYNQEYYDNNNRYPTPTEINVYVENYIPPNPTPTPIPTTTPDNPGNGGSVSGNTNNGGTASASATANNSGVNVTVNNNHNINFNVPGLSGNGIGSGTVSGNGNGSGGIFDWISDIGGVIGDFIKNVGQLIADVIKGITETITTVLADIPNIISVLVEFVYGGLPDELKAIITLGITTVIFVGVIKMMRK